MNKTARETLIKKLVRVAFANPEKRAGCLEMIAKLAGEDEKTEDAPEEAKTTDKTAGTLHYEGDRALDKVFAATDLLNEAKRDLPVGAARAEFDAAKNALHKLEGAVKQAEKPKKSAAAVTKAQVEKILKGEDYTFIDDYSGRGMEGANSPLAVTTDVSPTSEKGKKLLALGLSKDSLGKKFVYYLWASKNKKAALAKKLVRLAHANPEKRAEYLGMLAKLIPSS